MASDVDRGRQVYEQYEDALFRMVTDELAEQQGLELQSAWQAETSLPDSGPPPEAMRRFTEQLDAYLAQQQRADRRRQAFRRLHRIAVAVLAILVVFGTAMTTVQAFRLKVMNIWLEIQPQFTIFRLKETDQGPSGSDLIVDWTNAYVPTYIPEGYSIGSISIRESGREIVYEHDTAPMIYMELGETGSPLVDTEKADRVETIDINGHRGTLVQKNGMTTIVWEMDGRLFMVEVWSDDDTAVKVARGVKFIG